jgi:hypothetical protein
MDFLEKNKGHLLPQPKYIDIRKENGITLSSLWTIFVNKYRIKDNALLLSSKFNKHFNTFLNAIPIRDSDLDEQWGENYFFSVITTESFYETRIKRILNEKLEYHISQFDNHVNNCCYDIYPNELKSSIPLNESYYIDISSGCIWLISRSPQGFYHGIQTIVQIVENILFQLDSYEEFIIIPSMTIVDFPGIGNRGISVDLNSFQPTVEMLDELIPFLAKFKLNNLVLDFPSKLPYSKEEEHKIRDLCKFHQIDLSFSKQLQIEKILTVEIKFENQFIVPSYLRTLQEIATIPINFTLNNEILITTPVELNCPIDLLLPALPAFADLIWNPQITISSQLLDYWTEALQLTIFECNQLEHILNYENLRNTNNMLQIINRIRKSAYENTHLLDILEWEINIIAFEHEIRDLKMKLATEKVTTEVKFKLYQYLKDYSSLNSQLIKLTESLNRVKKGECELYFRSHHYNLKSLVESWIPEILKKIESTE